MSKVTAALVLPNMQEEQEAQVWTAISLVIRTDAVMTTGAATTEEVAAVV